MRWMARSPGVVAAVGTLAALVGVGLVAWGAGGVPAGFPLDDAWIHMVYGRALAAGRAFGYSPRETASGCTAPLWMAVLAALHRLVGTLGLGAIIHAVQGVGVVLHATTAALAGLIVHRLTRHPGLPIATALAVGLCPILGVAALSGMEVSATCAALLGALLAALSQRAWLSGVLLALALALRPESAVFVVLLGLWTVARHGRLAMPGLLRAALPVVAMSGALALAYTAASGRPLPATYYFKQQSAGLELPRRLAVIFGEMLPQWGPFLGGALYLLALGLWAAPSRDRLHRALPLGLGLAWIVGSAWTLPPTDPVAFYHQRYLLPGVVLLLVGLAVAAASAAEALTARGHTRFASAPWLLFALCTIPGALATARREGARYGQSVRNIDAVQRAMGMYLNRHAPRRARVATVDAGAVRYFSQRRTVDIMGLNSPGLFWQGASWAEAHPVSYFALMPAWFRPENPDDWALVQRFTAHPYTVTSFPQMATQILLACRRAGPVRILGVHTIGLVCVPPRDVR